MKLKREIQRSKRESWEKLCQKGEENQWGLPIILITKRLVRKKKISEISLPGRLEYIVDGLFPRHATGYLLLRSGTQIFPPEITTAEIKVMVSKTPSGKAPGPDGVPDIIIMNIAKIKPEILSNVFNSCSHTAFFRENGRLLG